MDIERATTADLPEILDLQYRAYQSEADLFKDRRIPPLTQTLADVEREHQTGAILKATDDAGRIIGSVRVRSESGTSYIGKLIVLPSMWGNGIGTRLLKEAEKLFPGDRMELFTSTRSARNLGLYEKLGYEAYKKERVNDELTLVYLQKQKV